MWSYRCIFNIRGFIVWRLHRSLKLLKRMRRIIYVHICIFRGTSYRYSSIIMGPLGGGGGIHRSFKTLRRDQQGLKGIKKIVYVLMDIFLYSFSIMYPLDRETTIYTINYPNIFIWDTPLGKEVKEVLKSFKARWTIYIYIYIYRERERERERGL